MRRRDFIKRIVGSAAAWPLAARAQQASPPVIGFLNTGAPDKFASLVDTFKEGLKQQGFIDPKNVLIEYRWARGQYDTLAALAEDLVQRRVALIAATGGPPSARAAKAATATMPIVFNVGDDPVKLGLVSSLNRPNGNATGVSFLVDALLSKQLGLLIELVPNASLVGALVNPSNVTAQSDIKSLQSAAESRQRGLLVVEAKTTDDFEKGFSVFSQKKVGALVIVVDAFLSSQMRELAALTKQYRIPASYAYRDFAAAGGLVTYGVSIEDVYREVGIYAGRILKGEKPSDLPVIQPTRFNLTINRKTANELGLVIPQTLLIAADEVIE